ncbi:NAD(P)H-hydrate dehydratase [Oceanobacillus piezotolerans]|uniref:Bifunctional NAD(P)H-hydrate repair enzyme n=1 Tax=Oceanobacillus piezotolerans TaxID=2448030 RepID=A0A498D861_9BACI|nr:NAD(P)H-hydrate dehydratase [Oceanobacillus piezotolerans]RLL42137.1 NAD(P)H-hydrate dehydratase [Oceanobacillus piezotolerans]
MYIATAKEMYDIDRYTMQEIGLDGKLLMENAGRAISEEIVKIIKENDRIIVFVGSGNNGGDGFVIARTLLEANYQVKVMQVVPNGKIAGDALYHKEIYLKCGGEAAVLEDDLNMMHSLRNTDVIIDAMLGIGVRGELREPIACCAKWINRSGAKVISVDIPSGLPAEESDESFTAIKADYTYLVGTAKLSAFLEKTAPYYGTWKVVSIGFPRWVIEAYSKRKVWLDHDFQSTMPRREPYSHKGNHGRGLIVGGSTRMPGSISMSVKAALKAGAGLVTAGTSKEIFHTIVSYCPEAMCVPLPEKDGYLTHSHTLKLDKYNCVAVGIGLGRHNDTTELVKSLIKSAPCPIIIDADGLYHLKNNLSNLKERTYPTIITPHPGEMAMLLDVTIPEILQFPFHYSSVFAKAHNVFVILKGKHTIITAPDGRQYINNTGNQGLAKGGSGDVLTGIVLSMVMQKQELFQALCNACYLHGKAADLMIRDTHSYYDLLATDVIDGIPKVYRTFS